MRQRLGGGERRLEWLGNGEKGEHIWESSYLLSLFMRLLLELNPSNKCRFQRTCKHCTQKSDEVRKNLNFSGTLKSLKKNHT